MLKIQKLNEWLENSSEELTIYLNEINHLFTGVDKMKVIDSKKKFIIAEWSDDKYKWDHEKPYGINWNHDNKIIEHFKNKYIQYNFELIPLTMDDDHSIRLKITKIK